MAKLIDALLHLVVANSPRTNALTWHWNRLAGITYSEHSHEDVRSSQFNCETLPVRRMMIIEADFGVPHLVVLES